jgi:hypothetical protein
VLTLISLRQVAKDQKEMKSWVELFYPFTVDAENEVSRFPHPHAAHAPPHHRTRAAF